MRGGSRESKGVEGVEIVARAQNEGLGDRVVGEGGWGEVDFRKWSLMETSRYAPLFRP